MHHQLAVPVEILAGPGDLFLAQAWVSEHVDSIRVGSIDDEEGLFAPVPGNDYFPALRTQPCPLVSSQRQYAPLRRGPPRTRHRRHYVYS